MKIFKKNDESLHQNNVCDIADLYKNDRVVVYKPQTLYKFKVDNEMYLSESVEVNVSEIFELAEVKVDDFELYQITRKGEELLEASEIIDFSKRGIEKFLFKKKCFKIMINGTSKEWAENCISFEEVVALAFGRCDTGNVNKAYTVVYTNGPRKNKEGSMIKGTRVFIKNKMRFDVTSTDRS
ncbi:multiubiquitin domain-containing protein [Flammeovirga sp. EKP202]|uniref:multiubiquitin domain-containing protein n=1 Tax=Flammeovirga sp. EKP202 TaxID=2770592 RepID=UPI00165F35FC|nr:multiubiquitin domain-containing protein [Flammeovirga sp. EKP202]MBD0403235.1 multiubiquitin domain-containing protein [Flammeovirga sp. EKP202]